MKNPFERDPAELDNTKDTKSYLQYWESGGIINEKDYESALTRAENTTTVDKTLIAQAKGIAETAKIKLHNTEGALGPIIILYGILRSDVAPEGVKYHHSQMSDQRLFAEALRMLRMPGYVESLDKMIEAYPNINFKYREEEAYKEEYKKAA